MNDERESPFLAREKALIRTAVRTGSPVLGICLGAPLIASACGARGYPCTREVGSREVRMVGPAADGPFPGFPDRFEVFQLHGEAFDLPSGAVPLCEGVPISTRRS